MLRFIKYLSLGLLGLCLIAMLSVFIVLKTPIGLTLAAKLLPDNIKVQKLDGTLSDLRLKNVTYEFDGGKLSVQTASLKWRALGLASRLIDVKNLELSHVRLDLVSSDEPPQQDLNEYQPWSGLSLPINIELHRVAVRGFELLQDRQRKLGLDNVDTHIKLFDNQLSLRHFTVSQQANQAQLSGEVDLEDTQLGGLSLNSAIEWSAGDHKVLASGDLSGTWQDFRVSQKIQQPLSANVDIQLQGALTKQPSWNASLNSLAAFDTSVLVPSTTQSTLGAKPTITAGEITSGGSILVGEGLAGVMATVNGRFEFGSFKLGEWACALDIKLDGPHLSVKSLRFEEQKNESLTRAAGQIALNAQVQDLTELLNSKFEHGDIAVDGSWSNVAVPLPEQAPTRKALTRKAVQNNEFFSNGSFKAEVQDSALLVSAESDGKLIGNDFRLASEFAYQDKQFEIKNFKLSSGKTQVSAQGRFGESYNVSWAVNSPDLGQLIPEATGDLNGSGKITGARQSPVINSTINADNLRYQNIAISGLHSTVIAGLSGLDQPLNIQLEARELQLDNEPVSKAISLSVMGTMAKHTVQLGSQFLLTSPEQNEAKFSATLSGDTKALEPALQWSGALSQLRIDADSYGDWLLSEPANIMLVDEALSLSEACISSGTQAFCAQADAKQKEQHFRVRIQSLELEPLNAFAGLYDLSVSGALSGELNYVKRLGANYPEINASITSNDASISWQELIDEQFVEKNLVFESINLDAIQNDTLRAKADMVLNDEKGTFTVDVGVSNPIGASNFDRSQLGGSVKLSLQELSDLPPTLMAGLILNGQLNGAMSLSGSVAQPEVSLNTELNGASAQIPELGLLLEDITFDAYTQSQSLLKLKGGARSGSGALEIEGVVNLNEIAKPIIQLQIAGDAVTLANTNEFRVIGSLDLETRLSSELISVGGELSIDEANIDFKIPETAIVASSDVVLADQQGQSDSAAQEIDIKIDLGSKTRIQAQGLDAKLSGSLRAYQQPDGILRGEGRIDVLDGRYIAYGQNLVIDSGQLVFNGGSIDDPNIRLRAEKITNSITAGVQASGRVSEPVLNLYSIPPLSDQDVLSVLIFDKPIGDLGSQDGLVLLRIANSLRGGGSSTVDNLTQGIQNTLGLTSLDLNLSGSDPSINAGKQLSSKFYVGYGYSLLNAAQTLLLKYQLNKAWSIKADVGADSGADLRYQIDR